MERPTNWMARHSSTLVYLSMVLLTAVTFNADRFGLSGSWLVVLLLVIALFKGQLVVDHFMGLRKVRWSWRLVLYTWLGLLGVVLAGAFILNAG